MATTEFVTGCVRMARRIRSQGDGSLSEMKIRNALAPLMSMRISMVYIFLDNNDNFSNIWRSTLPRLCCLIDSPILFPRHLPPSTPVDCRRKTTSTIPFSANPIPVKNLIHFHSRLLILPAVLLGACTLPLALAAKTSNPVLPGKTIRTEEGGRIPLRGYGVLQAFGTVSETPQGRVSLVRISAESEQAAQSLGSKYLADFTAYGQMEETPTPTLSPATVLKVNTGGTWVIGIRGKELFVLSSLSPQALQASADTLGASQWIPPQRNAYPRYLDCFDNASLGQWWMPSNKKDEILDFFRNNPGVVNVHGQTLCAGYAPNVYDSTGDDNAIAQAKLMGKPYRLMIWGDLPAWWGSNTLGNSDHILTPAPGALAQSMFSAGGYCMFQIASPRANAVLMDALAHVMNRYKDDPDLLAWLEPHGEFFLHREPTDSIPQSKQRFPKFLQKAKGYDLAKANQAYGTHAKSWDDLYYPDTAYFYGRRGEYFDLDTTPWRWQPGSDLAQDVQAGWNSPSFNDSAWPEDLRVSARVLSQFDKQNLVWPLWYRFSADIPSTLLSKSDPLYLHVMPCTEGKGKELSVWINGKELPSDQAEKPTVYLHAQYDVSSLLHEGKNQFAIYSKGGRIKYRVFLSRTPAEHFPYADAKLNQLYLDWNDCTIWETFQSLKSYLAAMRAIDPVRPIKVMTPHPFQSDAMELMARYGAYPQLTGEGAGWYRPMHYKGYSRLRGLPGSSEPGGPAKNASQMQGMFSNIFWESQDCHDYVFDPQRDFWPHKDVVQWRADNAPLLKTLGKTDFGPIRLGVLRDVEQDMRYSNSGIWKWDVSRGPLPSLGISPVLVDGPEFDRGLADKVPVIIDCATSVMTPERVASIQRYIAAGGTFVAMHNTGRHTPTERDTWPLARAFGLHIEDRLPSDQIYSAPIAPITFTKEQNLLPSLQGKKAEGSGVSLDYMGNKESGAIRIKTDLQTVKPIATWDDGSMAVCDIAYGKGRLVWLGSPFYLRFKDENGKWMNDADRQSLFAEMLRGLGVNLDTASSDPRVWIEKRESKNGLYTVYMTTAANIRGKDWKLEDQIPTSLSLLGQADAPVIDMTQAQPVEVPSEKTPDGLVLKEQIFHPFQVRQFAVVRSDAGLEAPLHWLQVQKNQWRPLDIPKKEQIDLEDIHRQTMKEAALMKQQGLDLNAQWKVRRFTATTPEVQDDWIAPNYVDSAWETGKLGTWQVNGWLDARRVQYRKTIPLSNEWTDPKKRFLLGFQGYHLLGLQGRATWTLNGKPMKETFGNFMLIDVTEQARQGQLQITLDVTGDSMGCGPGGVLYLKSVAKPRGSLDLAGAWDTMSNWHQTSGTITLPGSFKSILGIRRSFDLPESWAGKPVRLVVETNNPKGMNGIIVNSTGYCRVDADVKDGWAPLGMRIEQWLKPGKNTIDLYATGHMHITDNAKMNAQISNIRLEICE